MRARIKEDDSSVPSRHGPWLYYSRTELGDEYPRHCRRPLRDACADDVAEQVYLDENQLADGFDYFDLAELTLSPNHRLCAFMVDREGDELFEICCKDLDADALLDDRIEACGGSLAWLDDEWLVYTRRDEAHRPWQAWRHRIGTPVSADVCIWQEDDPAFFVSVHRTRSDAYLVISLESQVTSEQWLIPTSMPEAAPRPIAARRSGVEYQVAHHVDPAGHERLFMLTNDPAQGPAQNFKIMIGPATGAGPWRELIPAHEQVLLEDLDVFAGHLVVWERFEGLQRVRVVPLDPMPMRAGLTHRSSRSSNRGPSRVAEHLIAFPDPTYSLWPGSNPEFHSTSLRFGYSSMTTPTSIYDYDLGDRSRALRKRIEVVGGHDPSQYASARIWAPTSTGERIPISLVWKLDDDCIGSEQRPNRPRPLLLYAYGAYGATSDPSFSSTRLSLLERGAIRAIAHVRGGGELGRGWYEDGKLEHKHNSFSDYVACAEHLIAEDWTSPAQLAGSGGSAGGLLIGAVANARPDLFRAMVADVPFVDVLNTMLDPSLPLVGVEREEWGDPANEAGYRWIRAYSPYDNVRAQAYPDMLVTAGWNDPRVGYWEPAKWVARLRDRKLDDNEILLWTNLAGHGGASGRFEYLHELALEYAFLIDRLGLD
jgi:oligopeptidase B